MKKKVREMERKKKDRGSVRRHEKGERGGWERDRGELWTRRARAEIEWEEKKWQWVMLAALQRPGEKSAFITCMHAHKRSYTNRWKLHMCKNLPWREHTFTHYSLWILQEWVKVKKKRECKLCVCLHTDAANIFIAVGDLFHFAHMVIESNLGV